MKLVKKSKKGNRDFKICGGNRELKIPQDFLLYPIKKIFLKFISKKTIDKSKNQIYNVFKITK